MLLINNPNRLRTQVQPRLVLLTAIMLLSARLASAQSVTPSWTYTGSLNTARDGFTTTRLLNGQVLVVGGGNPRTGLLASAELYDPGTGTWSLTGDLRTARAHHTATLLANGKVLVAGGVASDQSFGPRILDTAELYDPTTRTWTDTGSLNGPRAQHSAILLKNGKVLILRGADTYFLNSAELYDPDTGRWSMTGSDFAFGPFGYTATRLENGNVLVVGGVVDDDDDPSCCLFADAELYNWITGSWSLTGKLNTSRFDHTATLLRNGSVLVAGGAYLNSAELYNPTTGTWSYTGNLNSFRAFHTATLLPNNRVLVAGGATGGNHFLSSAEIYDPVSGDWSATASLNTMRVRPQAVLLSNGKVLAVGGFRIVSILGSAELYDPGLTSTPNPIDDAAFFVRQHYLDFLNREPEPAGFEAWLRFMNDCASSDTECLHQKRLITSAGFFGSVEFQLKGYFVFRFYRVAFNRLPTFEEITPDMQNVTGQTAEEVYARKAAFTNSFVQRQEFVNTYGGLSNTDFVSSLLGRYQMDRVTTPDPGNANGNVKVLLTGNDLILGLNTGSLTRGQVLRAIADSDEVFNAEFNRAFVAMQYYGYLRRTPEPEGYNDWLDYLDEHPLDFLEMVRGFVDSWEYRSRFGEP